MEETRDGLTSEGGLFWGFLQDDAGDGATAERDEDEVAGTEVEVGGVGENAVRAVTEDFSGNYLEKHGSII